MDKKHLLIILDGWGLAKNPNHSAIDQAHTPFIDQLYRTYPHSRLTTSGLTVGLPQGHMGNSEVGHIHLGAGRVVPQALLRINEAVATRSLHQHTVLLQAFDYARAHKKKVHFMGLVSNGGIHAHINHLQALCNMAAEHGLKDVFIHAFTDGRDTAPAVADIFLKTLTQHCKQSAGQLASIMGRYYAMDRDKRWERVEIAYDALVHGKGTKTTNGHQAIQQAYQAGMTDEFLLPIIFTNPQGSPLACLAAGDVVVCFNFRPDRVRQITQVLTQKKLPDYNMHPLPLYYITFTPYNKAFKNVRVLFDNPTLSHTLGEILSQHQKTQLRIAETEKYPHVTYFFSGGREMPFAGEQRILCPSPKVATYDLAPAMRAFELTEKTIHALQQQKADFICLNFANADMVGHTGVFDAVVKACETVDQCLEKIIPLALRQGYTSLVIADHGNADSMRYNDGSVHTAHTTNPVPCIFVDPIYQGPLRNGTLSDVAPTILRSMGMAIPKAMDGKPLMDA